MHSKILRLRFNPDLAGQPVIHKLVKDYDLTFNIFQATIYPRKEGLLVMELSGHKKKFNQGVKYLKEVGIKVETVAQDIKRKEKVCFLYARMGVQIVMSRRTFVTESIRPAQWKTSRTAHSFQALAKALKLRSYCFSTSLGKQQAGSCFDDR